MQFKTTTVHYQQLLQRTMPIYRDLAALIERAEEGKYHVSKIVVGILLGTLLIAVLFLISLYTSKSYDADCISHDNCPTDQVCISQKCVDACAGRCGNNTVCKVSNHVPTCACIQKYVGNPLEGCQPLNQAAWWPSDSKAKKKYEVITSPKVNWYKAYTHCLQQGRRLVTIQSLEENNEIKSLLYSTTDVGDGYWTAGMNIFTRGVWFWITLGEPFSTYTDWHSDEPSYQYRQNNEECMELRMKTDFKKLAWNDQDCNDERFFICEYYE